MRGALGGRPDKSDKTPQAIEKERIYSRQKTLAERRHNNCLDKANLRPG